MTKGVSSGPSQRKIVIRMENRLYMINPFLYPNFLSLNFFFFSIVYQEISGLFYFVSVTVEFQIVSNQLRKLLEILPAAQTTTINPKSGKRTYLKRFSLI